MKVYRILDDFDNTQSIFPNVSDDIILDYALFDCKSKIGIVNTVDWYISNPLNKRGNFFSVMGAALVFDQAVYASELRFILEMAGEVIPIVLETGEMLYLSNITCCINALDNRRTRRHQYPNGEDGRILSYYFHENRRDEATIYKIPETCKAEILTYEGVKDSSDEFIGCYNALGFSGLKFELLWDSCTD